MTRHTVIWSVAADSSASACAGTRAGAVTSRSASWAFKKPAEHCSMYPRGTQRWLGWTLATQRDEQLSTFAQGSCQA